MPSLPAVQSVCGRGCPSAGHRVRRLFRARLAASGLVGAWLVTSALGCGSPAQHYEARHPDDPVGVMPADLGLPAEALIADGRKVLDDQPSAGRFPTGVSVVRVAAAVEPESRRRYVRVAPLSTESAVYWMHLWDDLPPVREVSTLRTLSLDPRGITCGDLLQASANIDCGLCLVYARSEDTEADAEFVAVLWDAARRKPLASFRVPAVLPDDVRAACAKAEQHGRWTGEPEFRAEADLRLLVRDALWDVAARDRATPTTQPNPWEGYVPFQTYEYDRLRKIQAIDRMLESGAEKQEKKRE